MALGKFAEVLVGMDVFEGIQVGTVEGFRVGILVCVGSAVG
jgi:threonine/homoserine/homoserine lactone efflux protein